MRGRLLGPSVAALLCWSGEAAAQTSADLAAELKRLGALIERQNARIAAQDVIIDRQGRALSELQSLGALDPGGLDTARGRGVSGSQAPPASADARSGAGRGAPALAALQPSAPEPSAPEPSARNSGAPDSGAQDLPSGPVGERPPMPAEPAIEVASLPEGSGVLTPRGRFTVDPSFEFTNSSSNRLVFRGVEIVTGFQVGVIEASDADRDTLSAAVAVRYGLTNRIEVEARVPYVDRSDQITTIARRNEDFDRVSDLEGSGIGDVELSGRYQITSGRNGRPVLIGALRYKSDTGTGPFDVARDEESVALELPTGSGFHAIEPALSFLYPTDPAVLFGSLSYLFHLPRDVDAVLGAGDAAVRVGRVDPGDSIGANVGFGFALNPRFSFSLGYRHNYILPTETELVSINQQGQPVSLQRSERLHVGAFTMGWSLRLTERLTLSTGFDFGATEDAPDVRVVLRLPYRF